MPSEYARQRVTPGPAARKCLVPDVRLLWPCLIVMAAALAGTARAASRTWTPGKPVRSCSRRIAPRATGRRKAWRRRRVRRWWASCASTTPAVPPRPPQWRRIFKPPDRAAPSGPRTRNNPRRIRRNKASRKRNLSRPSRRRRPIARKSRGRPSLSRTWLSPRLSLRLLVPMRLPAPTGLQAPARRTGPRSASGWPARWILAPIRRLRFRRVGARGAVRDRTRRPRRCRTSRPIHRRRQTLRREELTPPRRQPRAAEPKSRPRGPPARRSRPSSSRCHRAAAALRARLSRSPRPRPAPRSPASRRTPRRPPPELPPPSARA